MTDVLVIDEPGGTTQLLEQDPGDVLRVDGGVERVLSEGATSTDLLLIDTEPTVFEEVAVPPDVLVVDEPAGPARVEPMPGYPDTLIIQTGAPGPPGPPGVAATFEYQMPVAQTTALVEHNLGYDPVAIQVIDPGGHHLTGYDITVLVPGAQLRLGFDVSVAALIRLM